MTLNHSIQKKIIFVVSIILLTSFLIPTGVTDHDSSKDASDILWWYDLDAPSFGSAATADIDDDGLLELVFGTYFNDEHVYALNANNGTLLWKYDTGGCNDASPVIYDVDLDGDLEVIIPSSSPYEVYCFDGATGEVEWCTSTGYPNCIDSPPAIADVDNDDKPEVVLGSWYGYVFCLNGEDGGICWQVNIGPDSYIQAGPNIVDVDDDGQLDVVVTQYSGDCCVYSLYGNNGSTMWYSAAPTDYMYHGASFADIDEDGRPEIVIGCYDGQVYVFNGEDGSLAWEYTAPNYIGAPTSIADLDNDDHLEIVFTSYNYLGVLSHTGDLIWDYTTGGSMFRGASIADTNDDGVLDVVFGCDDGILRVVHGTNGSLLWSLDLEAHYGDTFEIDHAPVIEDLDDDGFLDICIIGGYGISNPDDNNHGRVYAIEAGGGTGPGWPMFRHDIHHSACFHYTPSDGTIIYVDDDADPSWYDATHVRTIQEGIINATQGGLIEVFAGTYEEHVIIDKTVDLSGEDKIMTIIDGGASGTVVSVVANDVCIHGFTIKNGGGSGDEAGIGIRSDGNRIYNTLISNNGYCGVFMNHAYTTQIFNNTIIENDGRGIYVWNESHVNTITQNNISCNGHEGIRIYDSDDTLISDNIIYHNEMDGVNMEECTNITCLRNLIIENHEDGIELYHASYNMFSENTISGNYDRGLLVQTHCGHNQIVHNEVKSNQLYGIQLYGTGCTHNQIHRNLIENNIDCGITISTDYNSILTNDICFHDGIGMVLDGDNNLLYHNNFVSNMIHAQGYGENTWNDDYPSGGNYWDDYTGTDVNGDGIGDTPYIIPGVSNQDDYPLMELYTEITMDINQSSFDRGFPIRHALDGDWAAAQSFIPNLDTLTSIDIYLRKFGNPEFDLTVELREDHPQGTLIDTLIFTPAEVPSSWEWFTLDFADTPITPGTDYFIVCPPAPSGVTTSFGYEWGYAIGNQYDDGAFWFTRDGGALWRDLPTMYEFVFKTYGIM